MAALTKYQHLDPFDVIDDRIFVLLEQRMDAACKIAQFKKEQGMELVDEQREESLLSRIRMKADKKSFPAESVVSIWEHILELSHIFQQK